jgi:hypothetical protein
MSLTLQEVKGRKEKKKKNEKRKSARIKRDKVGSERNAIISKNWEHNFFFFNLKKEKKKIKNMGHATWDLGQECQRMSS